MRHYGTTASIGYHHVHHLNPRIPNYRLKACHDAVPALSAKQPLTIRESVAGIRLKVWDEDSGKLVGFAQSTNQRRFQRF